MSEKITAPYLNEQILKLWHEQDYTVLNDLFEPDFVRKEPFQGIIDGREGMAAHVSVLNTQYTDLTISILEDIFDGRSYVTRWRFEGIDEGDYAGRLVPPTGRRVDFLGTSIFHLEDDKIVDELCYYDLLGVLQQLGLMPETIG